MKSFKSSVIKKMKYLHLNSMTDLRIKAFRLVKNLPGKKPTKIMLIDIIIFIEKLRNTVSNYGIYFFFHTISHK